jgi:hypothetical protein
MLNNSDYNNGISGTSSCATEAAAARTIQSWYRSRRACQWANRLLMWLHIVRLEHLAESTESGKGLCTQLACAESNHVTAASDATVVAHLREAVLAYEEAKLRENYTRALLFEELAESSSAMQTASPGARRQLRQQHPALRHLALCETLAKTALKSCSSPLHSSHPKNDKKTPSSFSSPPSTSVVDAVDELRALETFLSPPHFSWWRCTIEAPAMHLTSPADNSDGTPAKKYIDAVVDRRPPAALRAFEGQRLVSDTPNYDDRKCDGAALDAFMAADVVDDTAHADEDEVMDAAYAEGRRAVDAAAYEAAKSATLAGCPTSARVGEAPIDAALCGGGFESGTPPEWTRGDAQWADVNMVSQPVLGGQWCHVPSSVPGGTLDLSSALTCAVCELEGVVPANDANEKGGAEDVLTACVACGALVHVYCACTREVDGEQRCFCCSHCYAA